MEFFAGSEGDDHAEVFGCCPGFWAELDLNFVGSEGFAAFFIFLAGAAGAEIVSADLGHFLALVGFWIVW